MIVGRRRRRGGRTAGAAGDRRQRSGFGRLLLALVGGRSLLLLDLLVLAFDQRDQGVAATLQLQGGARLEEPIETELRSGTVGMGFVCFFYIISIDARLNLINFLPDSCAKVLVDVLLLEAQFVKHTDQEAILLFRVVFAFVAAVDEA